MSRKYGDNPYGQSQPPYGQQPLYPPQALYGQPQPVHGQQSPHDQSSQEKPPPSSRIRVNGHGIIGVGAIFLVILIASTRGWNIVWWYFVLSILAYSIAILFLTLYNENTTGRERFAVFQALLGCHIAFIFLAGGLWLNFSNFFVQVGIFIAAIAGGLVIPFILLKYNE